ICGCGRTSRPWPLLNSAGPKWSKNTNGPTVRRLAWGNARRTEKPSRSTERGTTTVSRASHAKRSPAAGSLPGKKLTGHLRCRRLLRDGYVGVDVRKVKPSCGKPNLHVRNAVRGHHSRESEERGFAPHGTRPAGRLGCCGRCDPWIWTVRPARVGWMLSKRDR